VADRLLAQVQSGETYRNPSLIGDGLSPDLLVLLDLYFNLPSMSPLRKAIAGYVMSAYN